MVQVAQSGLLAQQDSLTPAITVAVSVLVSLVGSVVFVAGLGWGLAGAAITTVACQYVGAIALLFALSKRGKVRRGRGQGRSVCLRAQGKDARKAAAAYVCVCVCVCAYAEGWMEEVEWGKAKERGKGGLGSDRAKAERRTADGGAPDGASGA